MVCLIVVLAGLSACTQGSSASSNTFAEPNNPITIGVSISNKKDAAGDDFVSDGAATLQGYQLWQDTINSNGGLLGRPVKLDVLYDDSDPDVVAANYTKLITKDRVNLVFGPFSSLLNKLGAGKVAAQYGYALVEGSGGAPSVFKQGWSNIFDVSLPVANNLITFAYYVLSLPPDQRPKKAAYLSSDDPFTFPQVDVARTLLENAGVKTVYPTGDKTSMPPDNSPLLNKLPAGYEQFNEGDTRTAAADADLVAHSGADVAILGTLLPDVKTEVAEFKKYNYNPKAMIATAGPDAGQDFVTTVGGTHYTEGFFVPNGWYPTSNTYQNSAMVSAYLNTYGGTADQINADVAEAFSVGQLVQQAAEKINSIDNAKLIQELHSTDVFNTVQGTVQFDSAGENLQAIAYLFQWQGGQFISVYPYSNAAENPEYPRPANF
jgi:branched-chain amino acid transport system substrate-binding protein